MKKYITCFLALFVILASFFGVACNKKEEEKPEDKKPDPTLIIEKTNYELIAGKDEKIITQFENTNFELAVSYSSSNESIAKVESGKIKAVGKGEATITASLVDYPEASVTLSVKVLGLPEITIEGENQVYTNHKIQLTSKVVSEFDVTDTPVWSTSDETIATIDENGLLTGKVAGTAVVSVKYGEYKGSVTIQVVKEPKQFVLNYEGGSSKELYVANGANAYYNLTSYNGSFWSGTNYASNIFISTKNSDPTATFSDRIYIGTNSETKNYEVVKILKSGSSSWPTGAQYVITISNSYGSFNVVHEQTEKINVGDIVMFSGDFTKATISKPVTVNFYSQELTSDKVIYTPGQTVVLPTPTRLGCNFLGWFDEEGNQVTTAPSVIDSYTNVYAKWEEKNPVTSISVSEISSTYVTGDTYQIVASVSPSDAYFTTLLYTTSNKEIMTVTSAGLLTAVNAGKVTITVSDYMKKFVNTYEITVEMEPSIDIQFPVSYNGILNVGESVQLEPTLVGNVGQGQLTYTSSDPTVLTVDASGKVTAVKGGDAKVTIAYGKYSLEVGVTVDATTESAKIDKLVKLLEKNNFAVVDSGNVSLYNDGRERYYAATYGSVNRFLFTDLVINEKYYATSEANANNHKARRAQDTIEFVCVHDTATLTGTSESIASGMSSGETSIHYTVGNDLVWGVVPEKYIAYHAGDGTGSTFTWSDTGVKDTGKAPKFGITAKGSGYVFTCNGTETSIVVPDCGTTQVSEALLTNLGPTWKVQNGNYYMGLTWWSSSYGKISSHGGNNNSIGIEMNVNISNDIYDTWQRTAKLVADILNRNNLDLTRVYQHNTFSGKNCPQDMISGNVWARFMEMVEIEYTILTQYNDMTITMKSNDPQIVGNDGRVVKAPTKTTTVSYDVTITSGSTTKTVRMYSVIPGSTTWEQWSGTYTAATIWNNGQFCKYE